MSILLHNSIDSMKNTVLECLSNAGVDIVVDKGADVDLREYLMDSLLFISFVVELEESLKVELPYEMLAYDAFASFNQICQRLTIFRMPSNKNY